MYITWPVGEGEGGGGGSDGSDGGYRWWWVPLMVDFASPFLCLSCLSLFASTMKWHVSFPIPVSHSFMPFLLLLLLFLFSLVCFVSSLPPRCRSRSQTDHIKIQMHGKKKHCKDSVWAMGARASWREIKYDGRGWQNENIHYEVENIATSKWPSR